MSEETKKAATEPSPPTTCSALELSGVDANIREYFEGNLDARYVAGLPSKMQCIRNQAALLQHLDKRQNSANNSEDSQNNIQPEDAIGELVRSFQMVFDGSGNVDSGLGDQCALYFFVQLGTDLGILAETGHDLANGLLKVSGGAVGHDNLKQNVEGQAIAPVHRRSLSTRPKGARTRCASTRLPAPPCSPIILVR